MLKLLHIMSGETSATHSLWKKRVVQGANLIISHEELAATLVIAIHLYVDWYLGLAFVSLALTIGLLLLFFFMQTAERPWTYPKALWLWALFLIVALFPSTLGITIKDTIYYYFNIVFNSLLMMWLGVLIAQNTQSVRRLFQMLAILAAILAIHTIIEAKTGIVLFKTHRYDAVLQESVSFQLGNSNIFRAEAFMLNPDSNGTLFAMLFFLPLGLFVEAHSLRKRIFYLVEMLLILLALFFTYSTAAWISALVGMMAFILLIRKIRYKIQIFLLIGTAIFAAFVFFPAQINLFWQHASDSSEWSLRIGVWETALLVIQAYPITGIGLGRFTYIQRSSPFQVPAQIIPVYHPHNSYLEFAALGGIPLGLSFIALLFVNFWFALRNLLSAENQLRTLLSSGFAIVMTLSFNSLANAGWTLTPLLAIGWFLLGVLASPLLQKKHREIYQKEQQDHEDQDHEESDSRSEIQQASEKESENV